jgi:NAD(P)-dependent dehydrogenase (short-subunit alcohol dehydrogenase family)
MRLRNKLAVVTAGASGMGRAGCLRFAKEGAKVAVVDLNEKGAGEVADAIKSGGGEAFVIPADLSKAEDCTQAMREAASVLGGIDVLWSHAGVPGTDEVEDIALEKYEMAMNLNVRSVYLCAGEAVKHMRVRGGGSVILTASISGLVGSQLSPLYSAGKFGVVGLAKSLALRYGPEKIRFNVVCPGLTNTPMLREFMGRSITDEEAAQTQKVFMAGIPLGRLGQPEDVANAALWLASDESSYVTGISIPIDGGYIAK